jgi:hypothetical protein
MATLPAIDPIPTEASGDPSFPALDPINSFDRVGPTAANRQPDALKQRDDTLHNRANLLIANSNAISTGAADSKVLFLPRDGVQAMLADLKMGAKKITGLAAGTADSDAVRKDQVGATNDLWPTPTGTPDDYVQVAAGRYQKTAGTGYVSFAGDSVQITTLVGGGETRYDLVHINDAGALGVTQGVAGTPGTVPEFPGDKMMIAIVKVDEDSGSIVVDAADITDVRPFLSADQNARALQSIPVDSAAPPTGTGLVYDGAKWGFGAAAGLKLKLEISSDAALSAVTVGETGCDFTDLAVALSYVAGLPRAVDRQCVVYLFEKRSGQSWSAGNISVAHNIHLIGVGRPTITMTGSLTLDNYATARDIHFSGVTYAYVNASAKLLSCGLTTSVIFVGLDQPMIYVGSWAEVDDIIATSTSNKWRPVVGPLSMDVTGPRISRITAIGTRGAPIVYGLFHYQATLTDWQISDLRYEDDLFTRVYIISNTNSTITVEGDHVAAFSKDRYFRVVGAGVAGNNRSYRVGGLGSTLTGGRTVIDCTLVPSANEGAGATTKAPAHEYAIFEEAPSTNSVLLYNAESLDVDEWPDDSAVYLSLGSENTGRYTVKSAVLESGVFMRITMNESMSGPTASGATPKKVLTRPIIDPVSGIGWQYDKYLELTDDYAIDTVYQAPCDLIVVVQGSGDTDLNIRGYTDASPDPAKLVAYDGVSSGGCKGCITFPVQRGYFWKIERGGSFNPGFSISVMAKGR